MKKTAVLLLALVSGLAYGQATSSFSSKTTQNLTGSAPTLVTDGVDLKNAIGFTVVVSAASGQTITGGSLVCYYYGAVSTAGGDAATMRWMLCPTSLNFTPATGGRDAPSGDYQPLTSFGRIFFMPSSVTVSSGTTVDVTITVRRRIQS